MNIRWFDTRTYIKISLSVILFWGGAAYANYFQELQTDFENSQTLRMEDIFPQSVKKYLKGKCFQANGKIYGTAIDFVALAAELERKHCVSAGGWFGEGAGSPSYCETIPAREQKMTINLSEVRWRASGMYCIDEDCDNKYFGQYKILERNGIKYFLKAGFSFDNTNHEMCYYAIT